MKGCAVTRLYNRAIGRQGMPMEAVELERAELSAAEMIATVIARTQQGALHDQAAELTNDLRQVSEVVGQLAAARKEIAVVSAGSLALASSYYGLAESFSALHAQLSVPPKERANRLPAALLRGAMKAAGNACYGYAWCIWNLHDTATPPRATGKAYTLDSIGQMFG